MRVNGRKGSQAFWLRANWLRADWLKPNWRRKASVALLLAVGAAGGTGACSYQHKTDSCESNAACQQTFGPGYVCAESGLCEQPEVDARCLDQTPVDLLQNPAKYRGYTIIGSLFRSVGKEGARHDAIRLAFADANDFLARNQGADSPLSELRFGLVHCQHDGNIDEVAELGRYLKEDLGAEVILGPATSSASQATFEALHQAGMSGALLVSPSATSVALSDLRAGGSDHFVRTAPMDDAQSLLMARHAEIEGVPLAVIYEETAYGRGLFDALQAQLGDDCDDCGISFDASTADELPLLRAIAADAAQQKLAAAELIFFLGAQESHIRGMIARMGDAEFQAKSFFFSDAAASNDTLTRVLPADYARIKGTRARSPSDTAALRLFEAAYEGVYDESPLIHSFTSHAYDAAWLTIGSAIATSLAGQELSADNLAEHYFDFSAESWGELAAAECPLSMVSGVCPPVTLDVAELPVLIESLERFGQVDVVGASGKLDYCEKERELAREADAFSIYHLEADGEDGFTLVDEVTPGVQVSSSRCPLDDEQSD